MAEEKELSKEQYWKLMSTRAGFSGVGFALGGIAGMATKRGIWGCVGYAILGSILGSGIGHLATRNGLHEKKIEQQNNDSEKHK
jgi:hypothetical protein